MKTSSVFKVSSKLLVAISETLLRGLPSSPHLFIIPFIISVGGTVIFICSDTEIISFRKSVIVSSSMLCSLLERKYCKYFSLVITLKFTDTTAFLCSIISQIEAKIKTKFKQIIFKNLLTLANLYRYDRR